jgi:hypothetical protein
MAVAANQRTGSGWLVNGNGFAGPFGAAELGAQQQAMDTARNRAAVGYVGAQTQGKQIENQLARLGLPMAQLRARAAMDPNFLSSIMGASGAPQMPSGTDQSSAAPSGGASPQVAAAIPMPAAFPSAVESIEAPSAGGSPFNKQGYVGNYQFGTAALADAGMYQPAQGEDLTKNQWQGKVTIPGFQPMSAQQFAANPQAQDAAFSHHVGNLSQKAQDLGLGQYVGKTVGGVPITQATLAGMMHFSGPTGTQKFLTSGGQYNPADANGTTISGYGTRINQAMSGGGSQSAAMPPPYQVASVGPTPGPPIASASGAGWPDDTDAARWWRRRDDGARGDGAVTGRSTARRGGADDGLRRDAGHD